MKKKGLIVATIVMVLVLAVSLTTATYAWFTTSNATSIDGFTLSVTAGNVMNIGLNAQGYTSYSAGATGDSFVSGSVTYVPGSTEGHFTGSYWTGNTGLSSTIDHDINWGAQSKAVGFTTSTTKEGATYGNTKEADLEDWAKIVKANGTATTMESADWAYANMNNTDPENITSGDYVYLFLGAQPTKFMQEDTNKLYIVVQSQGQGNTIGMAAAIHVAYRLNGATEWEDVDVWGTNKYSDAKGTKSVSIFGDYHTSTDITGGTYDEGTNKTTFTGAQMVEITLSEYFDASDELPLDQIEILIYIAGSDSDCRDEAKAGKIGIGIFFGAQEAAA